MWGKPLRKWLKWRKPLQEEWEYRRTVQRTYNLLSCYEGDGMANKEDQIAFLNYAIRAIKVDLCGSAMAGVISVDYDRKSNIAQSPDFFPVGWAYIIKKLSYENKVIECDVGSFISVPWRESSLLQAVSDVERNGFRFYPLNHWGSYYPELDLMISSNGLHHVVAAMFKERVTVNASIMPLEPIFPLLTTDGEVWNICGERQIPVLDQRFALMYEFARRISELKSH